MSRTQDCLETYSRLGDTSVSLLIRMGATGRNGEATGKVWVLTPKSRDIARELGLRIHPLRAEPGQGCQLLGFLDFRERPVEGAEGPPTLGDRCSPSLLRSKGRQVLMCQQPVQGRHLGPGRPGEPGRVDSGRCGLPSGSF